MATDSCLLDETLCDMPACQHPLCWASMRRLGRGRPRCRERKLGSSFESTSDDEEELPTMKIITLPNFQPLPSERMSGVHSPQRCCFARMELESLYGSIAYDTAARCISNKTSNYSLEKLHFPGLNSMRDLETSPRKNLRCIPRGKVQKLDVIDLDASALLSRCDSPKNPKPSVTWVPNSQQKCRRQRQPEGTRIQPTLRVGIKDLTANVLSCSADLGNRFTAFRMKRKKSNKVPTGGKPYNRSAAILQPPCTCHGRLPENLPSMDIKTKKKYSLCTDQGIPEDLPLQRRSYSSRQPCATTPELQDPESPLLGNRKVVLHQAKERHVHTLHLEAPCYKLDEKPTGAQKGMEIDLESIKNQSYLVKKYIDRVGPKGKIKVPGHCQKQVQQLDKAAYVLGGLGLFPGPMVTSRPCQKHGVKQLGGSITSKDESTDDSRAVSSRLATISGASFPVQNLDTTSTLSKQLSLNTDAPSEFSEEEKPSKLLMEPLAEKDSVKPEAEDVTLGEATEPLVQMPETQYAVSGESSKEHQGEEHLETLLEQSDLQPETELDNPLNDLQEAEEGEKDPSPHPPPPPPSPVLLDQEIPLDEGNPAEVEPATTSP